MSNQIYKFYQCPFCKSTHQVEVTEAPEIQKIQDHFTKYPVGDSSFSIKLDIDWNSCSACQKDFVDIAGYFLDDYIPDYVKSGGEWENFLHVLMAYEPFNEWLRNRSDEVKVREKLEEEEYERS